MEMMQEDAGDRLVCVHIAYGDAKLARKSARDLVEKRLAACVQSQPISSTYAWQGKIEEAGEVLLIAKTTLRRARDIEAYVWATHPYDEPEFLVLPAVAAGAGYATWARDWVRNSKP